MKQSVVTEEILDEKFKSFEDKLFNRLDEVMSELETIREEQTIGFHQFKELEKKVDKHEERITRLESSHP